MFTEVVISGGEDGNTIVWDSRSGTVVHSFKQNHCAPSALTLVSSNGDGSRVGLVMAAQVDKPVVHAYHWLKDQVLVKSTVPEKLSALCASNNGIYCAGGTFSGKIYVWEIASGNLVRAFDAHYKRISVLKFLQDDSALVSGSDDAGVNVWLTGEMLDDDSSDTLKPYFAWLEHTLPVTDVYCGFGLLNGARLATSSTDHTVKIWDLITGELLTTFLFPHAVTAITMDPAERILLAAAGNNIYSSHLYAYTQDPTTAAGRPNIHAVGGLGRVVGVGLTDSTDNSSTDQRGLAYIGHKATITSLTLNYDANILISASQDQTCIVWDVQSRQSIRTFTQHKAAVNFVQCILKPPELEAAGLFGSSGRFKHPIAAPLKRVKKTDEEEKEDGVPVILTATSLNMSDILQAIPSHPKDDTLQLIHDAKQRVNQLQSQSSTTSLEMQVESLQSDLIKVHEHYHKVKALHDQMYSSLVDDFMKERTRQQKTATKAQKANVAVGNYGDEDFEKLNPKTTHKEFLGVPGALGMMIGLPILTIFFAKFCNENGCPPTEFFHASLQDVQEWFSLETLQALFDPMAFAVYSAYIIALIVFYFALPGDRVEGAPLRNGKKLTYKVNGFATFHTLLSTLFMFLRPYGYKPLLFVYDHWLGIVGASLIWSFGVATFVYVYSFAPGKMLALGGNTGNPIYDYMIGRELNPRIGDFDIKYFVELRPGMIGWFLCNLCFTAKQYDSLGKVTIGMILVNVLQDFYIVDSLWNETAILTTMDITTDGFGWMLSFGLLTWVPMVYSLQTRYLAMHPRELSIPEIALTIAVAGIGYWIFRGTNSEKNTFRNNPNDPSVKDLKYIETKTGSRLLISGWWGKARHINYLGDWLMSLAMCLPCGYSTPIPYFYPIYFAVLLLHRERRDDEKCRKNGHTNNWAVLVCTSRFWFNYRHIANTLSIYRTVKRLGIPDSNIILMLADDVACNPRNKFPATVFNNANRALDLYGDNVEVDYRGYEVTVEAFIRLLTGRVPEDTPRSKRLLTDDRSNVLIYMTGHGGDEFLKFQDAEEISAYDIADALEQMWQKRRYNELLFMIDTCQANTMYKRMYSPNILATGSSELDESSYSHHTDYDIGVAVIDSWTYYNLEFLENIDMSSTATLADLFNSYDPVKINSHPGIRTDLFNRDLDKVRLTDFFGSVQNVELTPSRYKLLANRTSHTPPTTIHDTPIITMHNNQTSHSRTFHVDRTDTTLPIYSLAALTTSLTNGSRNGRKRPAEDDIEESDEDVGGLDDMDLRGSEGEESLDEEELNETAAEKRLRLAKDYLQTLRNREEEDVGGFMAEDVDRDIIADRLKKDALERTGKVHKFIASKLQLPVDVERIKSKKGHQLPVTAIVICEQGRVAYSGSKDGSIIKWSLPDLERLHTFVGGRKNLNQYEGHTAPVLCLAASTDGQFIASGGADNRVCIWSVKENRYVGGWRQHKDAVASVAFRHGSNQLYTASYDRTIKLYNVDALSYIETLFGHQDTILGIDTLQEERCVSAGGRDRTVRYWKIVEESQLVFRGGASFRNKDGSGTAISVEGSTDAVVCLGESNFISGGDSGALCLWDLNKKKPVYTQHHSHGFREHESQSEGTITTPHPILSIATLPYSDLIATGSTDDFVRLWHVSKDMRKLESIGAIPMKGCVNGLSLAQIGRQIILCCAVGQEMRLGRWERMKDAKNGVRCVILDEVLTNGHA
ncbi:hypothetical protein BZG36_01634 [Bifiguratus adelaidae]|uniref:Delta(14)-sterol reductase n=1 Tax=Bifiguratus adelaidae TaxID=1938954 RepID=A0A261Y4C5_9FUNG|nr:hypothetical protein BZG36_01634 [Bifiguratus adelaidae]